MAEERITCSKTVYMGGRNFMGLIKALMQHVDSMLVVAVGGCKPGDGVCGWPVELCAQIMKLLHAGR